MRIKSNIKRGLLLSVVFLLSLFSFIYVNSQELSQQIYTTHNSEEEVRNEKLSPEVTAVKFMLGVASFIFTSDR
jgi:hypothetical protein